MEKNTKDLRKKDGGSFHKEVDEHPSYGMVSLSKVSVGGTGGGVPLFGSSIRHNNYLELRITQAERCRDEYSNHYFSRKRIIEIGITPSQLSELLTHTNIPGTPCTILWTEKDGYREPCPTWNVAEEMKDDLENRFRELSERVSGLEKNIKEKLKGNIKKATKDEIAFDVLKICQEVKSNLEFLQKRQVDKLENIQAEMVSEAHTKIENLIENIGVKGLQEYLDKGLPNKETHRIKLKRP